MRSDFKDYITLALCTLECLIFGGPLFGWPFLAYVYKGLGLFSCNSDLAINGTQSCLDQDLYLPLALNVGMVAALGLGALPMGWLFQRFGLRVVRSIAVMAGVGGTLVLAFAINMNPFLIYLGTFLTIGAFGIIIFTNHHIALLAGVRAPIVNQINAGAVRSSGFILFLVKLAYDHGISPRWSLIGLACLWILVILTTFVLLPPYKVDHGEGDSAVKSRSTRHPMSSKHSVRGFMASSGNTLKFLTGPAMQQEGHETENKPSPPQDHDSPVHSVWYYIKSFPYMMHLLYFNILFLWHGFIFGILNTWLSLIYNRDQVLVSNATNVYGCIQFAIGLLFIPVPGALISWVRSWLIRTGNMPDDASAVVRVVMTAPNLVVASLSYALVAICMLLPLPASPYLVFVFAEVGKAFLGTTLAFIFIMFPMEHFGVLFGVMVTASVVGLPVQYGLLRWYAASGYTQATKFMLAIPVVTLIHPVIIIINYLREKKRKVVERTTHGTDDKTEQAMPLASSQ